MRHRTPLLLLLLLLLLMATTRNAETPPNFVPKTLQNRAQKVPNVPSETLEKKRTFACLCDNRLVASCRFQLDSWPPLETLKRHLISCPKRAKIEPKNCLTSLLKA